MSFLSKAYRRPLPDLVKTYFAGGDEFVDIWTTHRLENYQSDALRCRLVHAYQSNRFYREKFDAVGARPTAMEFPRDMAQIPLTTKDEIRGKPWLLLSVPRHAISQIQVSTGTTGGEEIYISHTWEDLHVNYISPAMRRLIPVGTSDVVVDALPYEMSSAGLACHRTFQRGYGALVVPAGKGGYYSTPERTLKAAKDLGATILITAPSNAISLAEAAAGEGCDLSSIPLRFVWLTGEGCSPALRARIERLWGKPAYFYYGSLEAGPIGIECAAQSGLHVAGGHVYLEIIGPKTGERLPPGETGEIVITELTRMASPLIRYRTGDTGLIETAKCSCGLELPKLILRGRIGDQIRIGKKVYGPYQLEQYLMEIPEAGNWYQLLPSGDQLEILLEPAHGIKIEAKLAESIASRFESSTGIKTKITLVNRIPRAGGKAIRVVR